VGDQKVQLVCAGHIEDVGDGALKAKYFLHVEPVADRPADQILIDSFQCVLDDFQFLLHLGLDHGVCHPLSLSRLRLEQDIEQPGTACGGASTRGMSARAASRTSARWFASVIIGTAAALIA
jgi:hypothetical protein